MHLVNSLVGAVRVPCSVLVYRSLNGPCQCATGQSDCPDESSGQPARIRADIVVTNLA